jgi:dipeptidyl aminopeptidase/acylaminoacyl peptidase
MIPVSGSQLWAPDRGTSTIVVTHDDLGKQDGFYRIDLATGKSSRLLETGQCYTCAYVVNPFVVTNDARHLAYFAEDARNDLDMWISDSDFRAPRRLTHLNRQFDKYRMGRARLIDWLSEDGEKLQGALLLPSDYEEGKHYPLVVWVLGGESLSDHFDHFGLSYRGPFNMQLLGTRGYAVLLPDSVLHLGTPMVDVAKTVLGGVNKVIDMGIADPDRLGVMGHSYGGYNVLALLVQTGRFKAAAEVDGYANLVGNYGIMNKDGRAFGTSVMERGQGLMGGPPWEFPNRYVENSPIFYLDRVQTPLLIVQGAKDETVPSFLADEIFVGLRRLGKEIEYAKYDGEDHSPLYWTYGNQVDFCNRMIWWFDKHLKSTN